MDHDPIVVTHAAALMATNDATHAVEGDLRAVDEVVEKAGKLLDLTQPVALLFVGLTRRPAGLTKPVRRQRR